MYFSPSSVKGLYNTFAKRIIFLSLFCCMSLLSKAIGPLAPKIAKKDIEIIFCGLFRPEMFMGKNTSLLNNNNFDDRTWFARSYLDLTTDIFYGAASYGKPVAECFFAVRNKAIWGSPQTISFTDSAVSKDLNEVGRPHRHGFARNIFWIREVWLTLDVKYALQWGCAQDFAIKLGAFPFELGRGIALGDAYAVGPELLGFFSDGAIDQFAFGGLLSGDVIHNVLSCDLYTGILQNKCSTLGETGEKILGQEYGRLDRPSRGFGIVNFVFAGRLPWTVFNESKWGKFVIEPYALANHDPEQKVEFLGDASSILGTMGCAVEYAGSWCELGFDYAVNIGHQRVKGWDRNQIIKENRGGVEIEVNSHVIDQNKQRIPFVSAGSPTQQLIYTTFQSETQNNQLIPNGTVPGLLIGGIAQGKTIGAAVDTVVTVNVPNLVMSSARNRFRDPYINEYNGWMFVIDAAGYLYKKDLKMAFMAGIATGDDNPNLTTQDGRYSGFIPIQSIYSGKRVRSVFLLGGAGKLNRPLSVPTSEQAPSLFANVVNGFTNLVLCGASLTWEPKNWTHKFKFMPNVLAYWQEKPTHKFDARTQKVLDARASSFLGVEADFFMDFYPLDAVRLYCVGSAFFPGQHYKDIRGLPLNRDQQMALDRLDATGFDEDGIPNLGDNIAYTFNFGIDFKF